MLSLTIYRQSTSSASYYEKTLATGAVRCIDSEIPFPLPTGWEWARLNELASYRKGPFGSSLTKSMFIPKSDTAIKVYEQKNAIQKDFRLGEYFVSNDKFESMLSFVVGPQDIIVSCAGTIGEVYLLPKEAPVGIINQALMRVRLYDLRLNDFWQILFEHILISESQMSGAGSAIKNIPPFEILKSFLVPIPPIQEQHRIVDLYKSLCLQCVKYDEYSNSLHTLNKGVRTTLKKSILQEAIQGKLVPQIESEGTAEELLAEIRAEKQRLVKEGKLKKSAIANESRIFRDVDNRYYRNTEKGILCIDKEIPFEIPNSWCWCRLGDIFAHNTGKALNGGGKGEYLRPYITTSNLYWDRFDLSSVKKMYFSKQELDKCTAQKGDLLVCEGGDVGRAAIWEQKDICLQNHVHKLRAYLPVCQRYFLYVFWHYKDIGFIGGKGIGIQGLSANALHNLILPLPPYEEQKRIADAIDSYFKILSK